MKSTQNSILRRIRAKPRGWVFTAKDFVDLGTRNTVGVTLHRLLKKEIIRKVGYGLYDFPIKHPKLGTLAPKPDDIAKAIASRSGDVIQPSPAKSANQMGLDTQVPAKPAYLTSGKSTQKKIANYPMRFSHSTFLTKAPLNPTNITVINVLKHLGKNNITKNILAKCASTLSRKDKSQLNKNLKQFPYWMIPFIIKLTEK